MALTRAKRKLVVVGDSATLTSDPVWAAFWDWAAMPGSGDAESLSIAYRSYYELPPEGGW